MRDKTLYGLCICGKKAIPYLYEVLNDLNPLVRSGVLEVFARMYMEEVVPTLLEFFKKEKDPKVKILYIKCLAKLGVQEQTVVEEFIRILRKEQNENVLAELITGLRWAAGEMKPRFTPPPEDKSELLRTIAGTSLLEKWRDPETTEFVKLYLVKALGELKEIRVLSDLANLLNPMEMGTGPLQIMAMQALKMIGTPESVFILINCLNHPRKEVNEAAVPLLASLNAQALDALIGVVNDRSKSSLARGGCVDAIGRIMDFGISSVDKGKNMEKAYKTLQAVQSDPDRYVADKAKEALERLKRNNVKGDLEHLII